MKIWKLIALTLLAAAFVGLTGCGQSGDDKDEASAEKSYNWRFALEETKGGVQWAYAQKFKELMAEKTDGKVNVEIFPYGSLGTSQDLTQQVQNGALQFSFASAGHVGSTIPEAQVFTLHFLFADEDEINEKIFAGNETVYDLLGEAYNEKGLELLAIIPEGWMVWSSNDPIRMPDDFDGMKTRVKPSPLLLETYKSYGAIPTPMAYSEIYGGLQRGQIDAQTQPMFAIRDMSFYEVQNYLTEAHNAHFVSTVITQPSFFNDLPENIQQAVMETKEELFPYIFEETDKLNEGAAKEIRSKSDIEFIELNDEQRAAFSERVEPVFDTFVEKAGPRGEKILDAIRTQIEEEQAK